MTICTFIQRDLYIRGDGGINGPTQKENNYAKNIDKATNDKPRIEDYGDSRFFQGSKSEASQLLVYMSKNAGVEMSMYKTSQGYYFDEINGYAFGRIDKNSQTLNTYWGSRENGTPIYFLENTIDGATPFSAQVRKFGYDTYSNESLYIGLGLNQNYKVTEFYHTHPGDTHLSLRDAFQKIVPCFAIGWDGISRGPYNYAPDGSIILDNVSVSSH